MERGTKAGLCLTSWSGQEALAADPSRGLARPDLALALAHRTGPKQLGEHDGPTH